MTDTELASEEGRPAAAVVWLLYILGVLSAGVLMLVGAIVAYAARGSSAGWVRSHYDSQIRLFWQAVWWHVLPWVVVILLIAVFGLGLLFLWLPGFISFVVQIWVTVKSVFGLIRLIEAKPA